MSDVSNITQDYFAPVEIVRCRDCSHMYNRYYNLKSWEVMYNNKAITNTPVHRSMFDFLGDILKWIGLERIINKYVIEIGAGSGHLSRTVSQYAKSVQVFEPNSSLVPDMLPEANITLINDIFSEDLIYGKADLIICRQVIEHLTDPLELIKKMKNALSADGFLYIEVPNAEFIENHGAFFDFHNAHVQYFNRSNLCYLTQKAGFEVFDELSIKEGHDIGLLLRPSEKKILAAPEPPYSERQHSLYMNHFEELKTEIRKHSPPYILYGAAWHAVSMLSVMGDNLEFTAALDDTLFYADQFLYNDRQQVPVFLSHAMDLNSRSTIVVTSFLHHEAITRRLAEMGFSGSIVNILNPSEKTLFSQSA